jgi:hypothetical protein
MIGFHARHPAWQTRPGPAPAKGADSGKIFIFAMERPIQAAQLLADFAAFVAVFKRFGSMRTQSGGALPNLRDIGLTGLGNDLCFHGLINSKCFCFIARTAGRTGFPRDDSSGLKRWKLTRPYHADEKIVSWSGASG